MRFAIRLIVEEAAQLAAQLPMLIRRLYYEGWDPSRIPRKMRQDEFVDMFAEQAAMEPHQEPLPGLRAAARVMRRRVTPGETADVLGVLPKEIRTLLD